MTVFLDKLIIKHWKLMPCKLLLTHQANKLIKNYGVAANLTECASLKCH